ncbi:hypothetical protein WR25_23889 isoform A [Diploscapter pachys]|uniref:Uncharacterized protein n=1 Tax=Diploscapter pachys TaxID=2018661 RepID=A0A2A2L1E9_9BILA|nr:hypothetical protein WR25_23889 isoform A [Diploscapter pachys]
MLPQTPAPMSIPMPSPQPAYQIAPVSVPVPMAVPVPVVSQPSPMPVPALPYSTPISTAHFVNAAPQPLEPLPAPAAVSAHLTSFQVAPSVPVQLPAAPYFGYPNGGYRMNRFKRVGGNAPSTKHPAPPMPIPQPSSYSSVPIQPISIPSQITAPNYQQPQVQVSSNYQEQPVVQQQQPLDSSAPAPFAPSSSQTVASVQNADQTFFSSPSEGGSSYNDVSASSPVAADPANNGGYLVII